ncbi:HIT domain-containing protein [Streptomyces sp. NBC_00638]|uniref:HIT family protein n=1 Tax=Streptomyces sp. NBC_00638 TaxID=2975794 RepID=UPI0022592B53|nr:HIT domain-containing protein [Streptomyces sp. NBC_00638]MCX5007782.1 HIT domain-containing protein [Streptomyces sp. NBC_00638]
MHSTDVNADYDACEFCSPRNSEHWFNAPVATTEDFSAIPSVGSFVPGYLLVIPKRHLFSSSQLPQDLKRAFSQFITDLSSHLQSLYSSPVTIFEHGASESLNDKSSSCVSHAHVHLVPGDYDLVSHMPDSGKSYASLDDFMEPRREYPYLMCSHSGRVHCYPDLPISQYYRRAVATALGKPDSWDYAAFPYWDNLRQTYKDFQSFRFPY